MYFKILNVKTDPGRLRRLLEKNNEINWLMCQKSAGEFCWVCTLKNLVEILREGHQVHPSQSTFRLQKLMKQFITWLFASISVTSDF